LHLAWLNAIEGGWLIALHASHLWLYILQSYIPRHGRVRQVNIYQTDAHYPRQRLLGRGQAWVHQAGFPEHIHGHAVNDQGNGHAEDFLWSGRA